MKGGLTTWYSIRARAHMKDLVELEEVSAGNLHGAKTRIAEFRAKYPDAYLIWVMRHNKGGRVVCLHDLTVHEGKTAAERRTVAVADALAAAEIRRQAR